MIFRLALFIVVPFCALFTPHVVADEPSSPAEESTVPLDRVFVPVGFDDNDLVQVVVAGEFPDTCHSVGSTNLNIDTAGKRIQIEQVSYKTSDVCLRMLSPFTQVVTLGILPAGEYTLSDENSGTTLGTIRITAAKAATSDDFLYAPVSDADIVPAEKAGEPQKLVIRGAFYDRCASMKEVRVGYYTDVLVVQPILAMKKGPSCGFEKRRYQSTVTLDRKIQGTWLLHVRSMNGTAINKIVDIP